MTAPPPPFADNAPQPLRPGDPGTFDPAFAARHYPWLRRLFHGYFRARVKGLGELPEGPFVSVGNHNGSVMMPDLGVWMTAYHTEQRKTPLVALAHDLVFRTLPRPFAHTLARLGAVRASPAAAARSLSLGFAVHIYPGGDLDAAKPFHARHEIRFGGHVGYVRLALRAGVPIVPVVSAGAHETLFILWDGRSFARASGLSERARLAVFPLMLCVPWGLWFGIPPGFIPLPSQITLRVLPPLSLNGYGPEDAADPRIVARIDEEVRARMQVELLEMARGRIPLVGRL